MTIRLVDVPERVRSGDLLCIVSMSGGKDSTATALALREADVEARYVFADTGWEAPETYEHLDELRCHLGPIDVVGRKGGMVALARKKAGFPQRLGRWCTEKLKMTPLREYHDAFEVETVNVVGVRAEESAARAKMPEWEDAETWNGLVWRPILAWSIAEVLAIHHRHGVPINPLYKRGHNRVGCYPCILAQKDEIRLVAKDAPWRIAEIRALEAEQSAERARRNADGTGKFKHAASTFFSARESLGPKGIDEVVGWANTTRGGRMLPLLAPEPDGGCFRWGMCEPPAPEEDPEAA